MSHSPVGGAPFLSLGGGLLSYEDTGHGGGMPHIQDLSSPSEGHQLQGDSDSEYNDDYAQQLDDAAANEESDEENSDGGDDQAADSEEDEDEAEDEEASDPESENEDDAGDEDDEDASDDPQQEQGGGAGPNSFRRARSTMNRRGRVRQCHSTGSLASTPSNTAHAVKCVRAKPYSLSMLCLCSNLHKGVKVPNKMYAGSATLILSETVPP
mmetsp:Transcript_29535/g.52888  ORF Transcript_29535/g.52888 Transcript_29535/m.52888 type:complete len:211 (+) Transcript_29535:304-936(+)